MREIVARLSVLSNFTGAIGYTVAYDPAFQVFGIMTDWYRCLLNACESCLFSLQHNGLGLEILDGLILIAHCYFKVIYTAI
jgi:hypothetical protein